MSTRLFKFRTGKTVNFMMMPYDYNCAVLGKIVADQVEEYKKEKRQAKKAVVTEVDIESRIVTIETFD